MDGYAVRAADTAGATDDAPVRLRVVGELPAGRAPTTPVGAGRGDPHHDRRADARRRRRDRDGRAHEARRRRRRARRRARPVTASTCAPPAATSRPATWCSRPAPCSGPRTWACSRASTSGRSRCTRARGWACSRPATSWSRRGRSRPARSATRTGRCCWRCSSRSGFEPVDLGIARDDEAAMTAAIDDALPRVRRGDHERRGVGRRLRLRERRARAHRGGRPDPRAPRRLVPGRDQAREAVVLLVRAWPCRCSGCPATRCRRS